MRSISARSANRLLLAGVALYIASVVVVLAQQRSYEIATLVAFGAHIAVGGLIVVRRPGNGLGLLLVAYGSVWAMVSAGVVTAEALDEAGHLDAASWVSLAAMVASTPTMWLIAATWLVFPDGQTTTRSDRRLLRVSGVVAIVATFAGAFSTPQVLPETKAYPHPFVDADLAQALYDILTGIIILSFLFGYFVAARLIIRMRHGDSIERRQVGWIAAAVIANITILLGNVIIAPLGTEDRAFLLIDAVGIILVPLGIGVAIFKYQLYGIDTIVNRSVTFGALAAFIAGVYVAIVVGVGSLLGSDAGFGLSLVASAVVAIAFQPARSRVQRWANRLVYGTRATPYEVLVRFSRRSAELPDDELLDRIPHLIVDGTGAEHATLWTRVDGGFRTRSTSPDEIEPRRIDGEKGFVDPEADYSLPVVHDGDLLGGLSLVKARGETVTPAEEELLANLASGLGLALRNARLTSELRRQVTELEASRERVLVASDEARRTLEHDLDSGPQQQLVALKVKLGPTRKLAERAGAPKAAELLAQLEHDAASTIQAVREFATGIFPPLLEADGLGVAIDQQASTAAIPVSLSADGIERYSREVETAVYFSVLEALQNAAKYAEATRVSVTLADDGECLHFEVRDDGRGFDAATTTRGAGLSGMADRLDTVGGAATVDSAPGDGTVVAGSVPIGALVSA